MDAAMKIAVILTAFDKMSDVVNSATSNAQKKIKDMKNSFVQGGAMMATGIGIMKSLSPAVEAFAKLEVANTDLQASMMDANGAISSHFEEVTKLAEGLGDLLPGTTADFDQMFESMMNNGVKSQSILDGVGKAAAFLAVDLKMSYVAAGEFSARMKEATGVADNEMMKFMDTISRLKSMGVNADEMRYAFSRSAGTLKMLGLQGLQASNDMGVFYASLIRGGMSGETAATSFNNIMQSMLDKKKFAKFSELARQNGLSFQMFDKEGKFLGVENLVAQFDKMKDLSIQKKADMVQALTGGGADGQALNTIIKSGTAGYAAMRSEMEKKASLNDKVNLKLKTLTAMWEATTGAIENMLAALGKGLGPILKPIAEMIGAIAGKIKEWLTLNPALAKFISLLIAMVGISVTIMGVVKVIQAIRIAMTLLNITIRANPFILIATVAIMALSFIYANWGTISEWFTRTWAKVRAAFYGAWNWIKGMFLNYTPQGLIIKHWDKIVAWFADLWTKVKEVFMAHVRFVAAIGSVFFNAGKNIITSVWNGMKAMVDKPIALIKAMVQKIRNLLPFSPAKDGPLRDIHKIRLVETIADSIKPLPLVNKMKSIVQHSFNALNSNPGQPIAARRNGPGNSSMNMNFNITISGGASKGDAGAFMAEIEKKFPILMKRFTAQQSRISLG